LCIAYTAIGESLPVKGATDQRIRTAIYSADEVFRLYGFVGYHIDLEFEADESFIDLSGGDLEALTFYGHGNILTLKPKAAAAEMNLAVTTTKRRYYFEYTASARRPTRFADPVMYAVRFVYGPAAGMAGPTPAQRIDQALQSAASERPRNFDYWFCGHPSLKPARTFDDGVHTRLTFGSRAELPAIFVRNDDGSESLLNFSMESGDMVVHRVAHRFILRRGKLSGCIVNKAFGGSGERLESGTVTPAVERERKEPRG
jgi:type IV secretion system protein VirB9